MPFRRNKKKDKDGKLSMRMKITLGLGSIAVILLISSGITAYELGRMRNYVDEHIKCINGVQRLSQKSGEYHLNILVAIGEDSRRIAEAGQFDEDFIYVEMPEMDEEWFRSQCDSIKTIFGEWEVSHFAESLMCAFDDYVSESHNLESVILSEFTDSRDWFFHTLNPLYNKLQENLNRVSDEVYFQLQKGSKIFKDDFRRNLMPEVVAVGAGFLLVLLLLVFLIVYYVNPVYKMLYGIQNSLLMRSKYKCTFDGNDQLSELNEKITDIMDENLELHRRVKALSEDKERLIEQLESSEE